MLTHLKRCHAEPAGSRASNERAVLFWLARPTANSMAMIGRLSMIRKSTYITTNAAPPYCPVI